MELFDGGNDWSDFVISNPTIESLSLKNFTKWILCWSFKADKLIKVCELLPNLNKNINNNNYLFLQIECCILINELN